LVEVMVVIAILAIFLALAVPSFQTMLEGNRLESAAAELASAIRLARMEATKRGAGARVTVTPNTATNWSTGWTVFVDTTNNANHGASPSFNALNGNTILRITDALPQAITVSSGALGYVSYVGSGDARVSVDDAGAADFDKASGGYTQGVIRLVSGSQSRCIKLVPPGLVDVAANASTCS
jgi:type II secretory pathway pseudopilin PulG